VDLDSDGFIEMMLLDGCLVLEYFLKWYEGRPNSIFEVGWNFACILSDLLLLENQIPFFGVELCEIGVNQEVRLNFANYLSGILTQGPTNNSLNPNPPAVIHHLVHLCYHCSAPDPGKPVIVLSSKSFDLSRILSPNRIKVLLIGFLLWVLTRRFLGSNS
jgi:Plant protein of unknown function